MPRTGAKRADGRQCVSVDSLDARQFHAIPVRTNSASDGGHDAAFDAGFEKVKVNTVPMRDVNHHQLIPSLLGFSLAPFRHASLNLWRRARERSFRKHHISGQVLRDELIKRG